MSTTIYPYVYVCTHRETGSIYIGARCANKVPAVEDLGIKYFTSSNYVRPIFNEFDYEIIFEGSKEDAFKLESDLINEHWKQPYLLNKGNHGIKFSVGKHSEETKSKMSKNHGRYWKGKSVNKERKQKISNSMKGKPHPQKTVICPHCGKSGGATNMTRYHFDNCKEKK